MMNIKWLVMLGSCSFLCLSLGVWYFSEQNSEVKEDVAKIVNEQQDNDIVAAPKIAAGVSTSSQRKALENGRGESGIVDASLSTNGEPRVTILPIGQMGYSSEEMETLRKKLKQEQQQGYSEASEETVQRIDNQVASQGALLPIAEALPQLSFYPSQLQSGSPLWQQDKLLGIQPAGTLVEGEGWSGAASVHAVKDVGNVLLVEKMLGQGDSVEYPLETINTTVKGHAAVFTVEVSPSGKALSSLTWTTNERDYALYVNGNANSKVEVKTALFELANALPLPYGGFQLPLTNQY